MTTIRDVVGDLEAEQAELDSIVAPIMTPEWDKPTPADGWSVRDQIGHLAYFDEVAAEAVLDRDGFGRRLELFRQAFLEGRDPMAAHLGRGRSLAAGEVLAWWRDARHKEIAAFTTLSGAERVPWFGPPMGAVSFVTARLMETWAHGQDVADALGIARVPTSRLRHVAHLGARTLRNSFTVRGEEVPADEVRVELVAPSGEVWTWGPEGAEEHVSGDALDFCLVVTQRRHVADTTLDVRGDAARAWMEIAQAFAGPPGPGRAPSGSGSAPSGASPASQ